MGYELASDYIGGGSRADGHQSDGSIGANAELGYNLL